MFSQAASLPTECIAGSGASCHVGCNQTGGNDKLCALQARLAMKVLKVFMPDSAGACMRGSQLSSAALQLLPLVLTTKTGAPDPNEPVDHQATELVWLTFGGRFHSTPSLQQWDERPACS